MLNNEVDVKVVENTNKENALPCPPDSYSEEDISSMSLDFITIQEETDKAKKAKITTKITKHTPVYTLTNKEKKQVLSYIKDMEKHILKFSGDGKDRFTYDCSKLTIPIFLELAKMFKEVNSKFYVELHNGPRHIIVDWAGKNEC